MKNECAEEKAIWWRRKLGVADVVKPNMAGIAYRAVAAGLIYECVETPDVELSDAEGAYDPATKTLYITSTVIAAARTGDFQARWTIAHELGHCAFGHSNKRYRSIGGKAYQTRYELPRLDERDADDFALAFLAPMRLVR